MCVNKIILKKDTSNFQLLFSCNMTIKKKNYSLKLGLITLVIQLLLSYKFYF